MEENRGVDKPGRSELRYARRRLIFIVLLVLWLASFSGFIVWQFMAFDKTNFPDPRPLRSMAEVSHFTGLSYPPHAVLIEGYSWEPLLCIAKIQLPRKEVSRFLDQQQFAEQVEKDQDTNIFEDLCATQKREKDLIAPWDVTGHHHTLLLRASDTRIRLELLAGWPLKQKHTYSGTLSFVIILDDPETATLYISWDCRGGFAC